MINRYFIRKKGKYLLFILGPLALIYLCLISCNKEIIEDGEGRITYLNPVWDISLHESGEYHSIGTITSNLINDDKAYMSRTNDSGVNVLSSIDIGSGNILWDWRDVFEPTERIEISDQLIYNDFLYYVKGSRHYRIEINSGKSVNNFRDDISYGTYFSCIKGECFLSGQRRADPHKFRKVIYSLSLDATKPKLLDIPELYNLSNDSIDVTFGNRNNAFESQNNKFILLGYATKDSRDYFQSYIALYNISTDSVIYKNMPVNDESGWFNGSLQHIRILNDRIYTISHRKAVCLDLWTGEKLWQRNFPKWFLTSGYEVSEGVFVANCEDTRLYGIDTETGELLWETEGAGASSPLKSRILNGIVYFSGGSTDRIHAVDIHTGETKWRLEPAKYDNAEDFKTDLYVSENPSGGKGKVIIFTGMNAYCLDAVQ